MTPPPPQRPPAAPTSRQSQTQATSLPREASPLLSPDSRDWADPVGKAEPTAAAASTREPGQDSSRFTPFFTLVEDAASSTSHHPAVYYIFSDDDETELITDAALRIEDKYRREVWSPGRENDGARLAAPQQEQQPPPPSTQERFILATLDTSGRNVESAQSMTDDWQVLGADVAPAPMLEGGEGETGGLMLKVRGTSGASTTATTSINLDDSAGMEALVESYRSRMEELRKVVEHGGNLPKERTDDRGEEEREYGEA